MKRLAVIPARGGSKRIPGKNIKEFCGKPMIAHIIQAAQNASIFDKIHVSTDDQNIADTAQKYGIENDFMRPANLSDDKTSMLEAIKYVIKEYKARGKEFDTIALLYATSPLTDPEDLRKACETFENGDPAKALLAITPFPAPIEQALRMQKDTSLAPDNARAMATRTQDLDHAYYDAGMFAFYTSSYIENSAGSGDFSKFRGFIVPSFRVTDIDWPDDWSRAESLFHAIKNKE